MSNRPDGLPNPEKIGEFFLAAILDELRAIRTALEKPTIVNVNAPIAPDAEQIVKEQGKRKRF